MHEYAGSPGSHHSALTSDHPSRCCRVFSVPETVDDVDFSALVSAALAGDHHAWDTLVQRLSGVVWKTVLGSSLSAEDRKDACAATFFRLYERLGTVREPAKLPGWVAAVARNEVVAIVRSSQRQRGDSRIALVDVRPHDEQLIDDELRAALAHAFARLPEEAQHLLRLLMQEPPLAYDDIAIRLGVPRGSIGPTRRRLLDRLRRMPELAPYVEGLVR